MEDNGGMAWIWRSIGDRVGAAWGNGKACTVECSVFEPGRDLRDMARFLFRCRA